jgi:WD40 repeat protein
LHGSSLAYFREVNNQKQLVFLDPDGVGRRIIPLPSEVQTDTRLISPDGKYLAYYSGSVGQCDPFGNTSIKDQLALNLLDLNTLQTRQVAALLSPDYPENFKSNAAGLFAQGLVAKNDENIITGLKSAFLCGIHSLAWSPDGNSLAFAGEMDGPSSDVYRYDLGTHKIQRLTDGLEEVQTIDWSTDPASLESTGALYYGEGMPFTYYKIASDGSGAKAIACHPGTKISLPDNKQIYVDYNSGNGVGFYGLRLVDIETCSSKNVWEGAFNQFEFDPGTDLIAFTARSLTVNKSSQNQNFAEAL